jgi:hypothetical protein
MRLEEISGRLSQEVKFGEGILGHLDRGGDFDVKQAEVCARFLGSDGLEGKYEGQGIVLIALLP